MNPVIAQGQITITNLTSIEVGPNEVHYAISDSGTEQPKVFALSLEQAMSQIKEGQYLWTQTIVSYNDSENTKKVASYSVSRIGQDTITIQVDPTSIVIEQTSSIVNGKRVAVWPTPLYNGAIKVTVFKGKTNVTSSYLKDVKLTEQNGITATLNNTTGVITLGSVTAQTGNQASIKLTYGSVVTTVSIYLNRLGELKNDIRDEVDNSYSYLKNALANGQTITTGGLVMTSMIALGAKQENGSFKVMSGISGVYQNDKSIAAWYGGEMKDLEDTTLSDTAKSLAAKSLFRFDGSGYLASGNISWDKDGRVAIKNIYFEDAEKNQHLLSAMWSLIADMFSYSTTKETGTVALIHPNAAFDSLEIYNPATKVGENVATQTWVTQTAKAHAAELADTATTANKVANALSWSGYSSGSYNGSSAKSIVIPTKSSWNYDDSYLKLTGGTLTGDLTFSNPGATGTRFITGTVANNDYWRIGGGGTSSDMGYMELATADNGNEPIYVRQYGGAYTSLVRTLTLLDANGDTSMPGNLTVAKNIISNGNITAKGGSITIGKITLSYDAANNAIKVNGNLYATGGVSALGSAATSGTGGSGTSYNRLDSWIDYGTGKDGYVLSAGLGYSLYTDVEALKGGSATTVNVTGAGNAVTSISKSGTEINVVKGATFLTQHQSLANYVAKDGGEGLRVGTATVTDNTELITSWASNNGFSDADGKGLLIRRPFYAVYNYIKGKLDSVYQVKGNYLTQHQSLAHSHTLKIGNTSKSVGLNGSQSWSLSEIGAAAAVHSHNALDIQVSSEASLNSTSNSFYVAYVGGNNGHAGRPDGVDAYSVMHLRTAYGWYGEIMLSNANGMYYRSAAEAQFNKDLAWEKLATESWVSGSYVKNNDIRLTNARPASDVYAWAKAPNKPTYTKSEVGLGNVDNTADANKSVKYATSAGNADTVDGVHLNGIFTGLSNSGNNISLTIGGVTKTLTVGYASNAVNLSQALAYNTNNPMAQNKYINGGTGLGWGTVYNGSGPVTYGNVLELGNSGKGQLFLEWNGAQTAVGDNGIGHLYYRSKRDCIAGFTAWRTIAFTTDTVAAANKVTSALSWSGFSSGSYNGSSVQSIVIPTKASWNYDDRYLKLTGGTITGSLTINSSAVIGGNATVNGGSIKLGGITISYDSTNKAIKIDGNLYATGAVSALGSSSDSTNTGGAGASYNRLDNWSDYTTGKKGYILSAGLGNELHDSVVSLLNGAAVSVTTTGGGNAITSITKSGTTITANKEATFLTQHQSLAHTHTLTIGNSTKAVSLNGTQSWSLSEIGAAASGHTHDFLVVARNEVNTSTHLKNDANNFAGKANVFYADELAAGSVNAPNGGWNYILSMNGADPYYAGQIALGMTVDGMWFRNKHTGWTGWKKVAITSDIPTKTSQLSNDSGFLTQHQSLDGRLPYTALNGGLITRPSQTWGTQVGSVVAAWDDNAGGSFAFRKNNPANGEISLVIDGTVYINEGTEAVASQKWVTDKGYVTSSVVDGYATQAWVNDLKLLPKAGGVMGSGAIIDWPDTGNWGKGNSGVTFPVDRGGLRWSGQSDGVYLHAVETASDNLELIIKFTDDNSNGLSIQNTGGATTARIAATGAGSFSSLTVGGQSVVLNNDTRLTNARPASDVYAWAKAANKPSYTKSEVGLGNVDNTADANKSVKYATSAGTASNLNVGGYGSGNAIYAGTGDNATYTTYNLRISSWFGIGFYDECYDKTHMVINTRTGDLSTEGKLTAASAVIGGSSVWTKGSLNKVSQLTNDANYVTATNHSHDWNTLTNVESSTLDTTNTWVPVIVNGKLRHRVIPVAYNNDPSTLTVKYAASAGNSDLLDGVHLNGIFTNLANNGNNVQLTIGGVTKALTINYAKNADTIDGAHLSDIKNWSDRTASAYWKAGWYKVASAQTATNTEAFLTLDVNAVQSNGHATLFIIKRADSKPYFICTHNNNLNLADFRLYYNGMSMVLYARVPYDWNGRVFRIISEGREGGYDHIWTLYSNMSSTDPNAISAEGENPYINPTYSGRVDWSNSSDKATRLQTSRTLWGRPFDGTANVSGDMTGVGNITMSGYISGSYASFSRTNNHGLEVGTIRGRQVGDRAGQFIHLYERVHIGSPNGWGSREAPANGLSTYGGAWLATDSGNVGIGTTSPAYKLDVNGAARVTGDTTIGGTLSINTENIDKINVDNSAFVVSKWPDDSTYFFWLKGRMCGSVDGANVDGGHYGGVVITGDKNKPVTGISMVRAGTTWNGIGIDTDNSFYFSSNPKDQTTGNVLARLYADGVFWTTKGIWSNGYVSALGQNTSSDSRLKDVTGEEHLTIDTIANAPAIRYTWKRKKDLGQCVGTIAQYWQEVMPEVVHENREGYLTMQYDVAALISSISIAKKVKNHEQRIHDLETENEYLRHEVELLKGKEV